MLTLLFSELPSFNKMQEYCLILRKIAGITILAICVLGFSALPVPAFCKILSVPGQPCFISIEQGKYEDGKIAKAYLRTSSKTYMLYELEGFKYISTQYSLINLDNDNIKDTVWTLKLENTDNGRQYTVWTVTLSSIKRGWIFSTPAGETRWKTLPIEIKVPKDILIYYSPTTPEYRNIPQYYGKGVLSFVYTIAITPDGPVLASVPTVYDSLAKISQLFIANEADPQLKLVYKDIFDDYNRMKEGKTPSKEAILNFEWEKILNFRWE